MKLYGKMGSRPIPAQAAICAVSVAEAIQELSSPADYARAVAILASDDAAMITGIDVRVDVGAPRNTGLGSSAEA